MSTAAQETSPRADVCVSGVCTAAALVACALLYAVLFSPEVQQGTSAPRDPFWSGARYLWWLPVALAHLLDAHSTRQRCFVVLLYAIATACVFAGTVALSFPHNPNVGATLRLALLVVPFHIGVAVGIEGLVYATGWPHNGHGKFRIARVTRALIGGAAVVAIPAMLFGYRHLVLESASQRAIGDAEVDWRTGAVCIFGSRAPSYDARGVIFSGEYDDRGICVRRPCGYAAYWVAYNRRVDELIVENGGYHAAVEVPAKRVMLTMLEADNLSKVADFPYVVSNGVILFKGEMERWGLGFSAAPNEVAIASRHSGLIVPTGRSDPVFVGHVKDYPACVIVRFGKEWLGAFSIDGRLLTSARRSPVQ